MYPINCLFKYVEITFLIWQSLILFNMLIYKNNEKYNVQYGIIWKSAILKFRKLSNVFLFICNLQPLEIFRVL